MTALIPHNPKTAQSEKVAKVLRRIHAPKSNRLYLRGEEIEKLMTAAGKTRNPVRDRLIVWMSYRHGLRSVELLTMQWPAIDFLAQQLHVWRAKNGKVSIHPIEGKELRLLRELQRQTPGRYLFLSERGAPLSDRGLRRVIMDLGTAAGLPFRVHHHMLRHSCGFALASKGVDTRAIQDYLGHRNIGHTVRYTTLNSDRFNGLWT
jgi:type 1 fimbriae regulatory protein FimB/type 1 fimbriae regulatory protein FimE